MMIVGLVFLVAVALLLIASTTVHIRVSALSRFELERRQAGGDKSAARELEREHTAHDVMSVLRVLSLLFVVAIVMLAVGIFGPVTGCIVSLLIVVFVGSLGRSRTIHVWFQGLFARYEPVIFRTIKRAEWLMSFIRYRRPARPVFAIDSKEELQHLVTRSHGILTPEQKRFITHSLKFHERRVSEIMTPRSRIDTVDRAELLGPLTLDNLHQTKRSSFPVVAGDIDHIVGLLHLEDVLHIDSGKRSTTVAKAMDVRVGYIHQDQTLDHALSVFLRSRHRLLIVVNEAEETVGLVALRDVIEALVGGSLPDAPQASDDRQAAAAPPLVNRP